MAMAVIVNGFPSGQRSIPSFQGQGFPGWKAKMLLILEGDELSDVVIGNSLCPSQPTVPDSDNVLITEGPVFEAWRLAYTDWQRRDKAARRYILCALSDSLMLDVYDFPTSHNVWEYLLANFQKKSVTETLYLRGLLSKLQYEVGTAMTGHIESFKSIINQLAAAGDPVPRKQLITILLDTIKDPSYDNIVTILSNKDGLDFDQTCISLIEYSQRQQRRSIGHDGVMFSQEEPESQQLERAFYVRRRPFQRGSRRGGRRGGSFSRLKFPNKNCSYCNRNGHTEDDCWARQYDEEHNITTKQPRLSRDSPLCDYCGKSDHPSSMCFKRRFDVDRNRAYAAQHHDNVVPETSCVLCSVPPDRILHVRDGSIFIIDSGATGNMTYESKWLHNYHPLPVKRVVYLADDTTCQVKGIGDLYLGTLSSSTRVLRGVLHVPDLQRNLLSVARLVDLGLSVGFDHTKCRIEKDGQIIATASRNGNLFELSLNDAVANVVTAPGDHDCKLWHHRFVHADFSKLLDLHRRGLVHGMDLKSHPHMGICEFCALGKHNRKPFPLSNSVHSHDLLDLVHTDICRPFPASRT